MQSVDSMAGPAAFLAVADSLIFTRAAERLGLSRAIVGAQVRTLEVRLGVRLLQGTTRAVTPIEVEKTYRQALAGLLLQAEEAERAAIACHTEAVGRLRISAPPDLGPAHLAPVIARYLSGYPGMRVELDLPARPVDLIAEGVDLAIGGALAVEQNLVTRRLGVPSIVACASPAYLSTHGVPERPEDLAPHACPHFAQLRLGRTWHFARGGRDTPRAQCAAARGR